MMELLVVVLLFFTYAIQCLPALLKPIARTYSAVRVPCLPEYWREEEFSTQENRGELQCVRMCVYDKICALSLFMRYQNGSDSCKRFSHTEFQMIPDVNVSDILMCSAYKLVSQCQNGGRFKHGVCSCTKDFTGDLCQYANPNFCNGNWTKILSSSGNKIFTLNEEKILSQMEVHKAKIRFRNKALNIISVASHGRALHRLIPLLYEQHTQTMLEKVTWNRTANNPARIFMYFSHLGTLETLTVGSNHNRFSSEKNNLAHDFLAVVHSPYQIAFSQSSDGWSHLRKNLENGYEMSGSSFINIQSDSEIISHMTFMRQSLMSGSDNFQNPPEWANVRAILGHRSDTLLTKLSQANTRKSWTLPTGFSKELRLNPCWTDVRSGGDGSMSSTYQLQGYLRLGHDVRVRWGHFYHTVLEVIQIGEELTFLLAAFMSNTGTETLGASNTFGVKSLVTSSDFQENCTHFMEGEAVNSFGHQTGLRVTWYVDRRTWSSVYAVYSNSSVAEGSLSQLSAGILEGKDVRVWIKWLYLDKSRFSSTHLNSVTDDGKVSSESVVTWRTEDRSSTKIRLSSSCDYEYVLVTSDGHVEVTDFNIWTPGQTTVQREVMITWFLN